MATLSALYPKPDGALGFTDYLSATWGDGLLLPISMAALVYAYQTLPPTGGDRVLVTVGGVCGAIGGVLTQVQWLRDDNPRLNWTLPAPHVFNNAGIYHAVFLTGAAAGFSAAWAGTLLRWARNPQIRDRRVSQALGVALLSGLGFACLLVVDNQQTQKRSSSGFTLVALGGAVLTGVAGMSVATWFRRRRRGRGLHRRIP
jgi:hypothetical protein